MASLAGDTSQASAPALAARKSGSVGCGLKPARLSGPLSPGPKKSGSVRSRLGEDIASPRFVQVAEKDLDKLLPGALTGFRGSREVHNVNPPSSVDSLSGKSTARAWEIDEEGDRMRMAALEAALDMTIAALSASSDSTSRLSFAEDNSHSNPFTSAAQKSVDSLDDTDININTSLYIHDGDAERLLLLNCSTDGQGQLALCVLGQAAYIGSSCGSNASRSCRVV